MGIVSLQDLQRRSDKAEFFEGLLNQTSVDQLLVEVVSLC